MSFDETDAREKRSWDNTTDHLVLLLANRMVPRSLNAGNVLFDQGDHDDRLYILDAGMLEVSVLAASGRKLSLNRLHPGNVFGEIAIFDPGPRTARIVALTPCRLRSIRQQVLLDEVSRQPALATEMLRLAGQRLRWMSRRMEDQVFLAPASHLASRLLMLSDGAGPVEISQAQLADFVGVTREVVSKTLGAWRRDGIVDLSRGRIVVLDRESLRDIRDSDLV